MDEIKRLSEKFEQYCVARDVVAILAAGGIVLTSDRHSSSFWGLFAVMYIYAVDLTYRFYFYKPNHHHVAVQGLDCCEITGSPRVLWDQ